jgi:hypothetical protein
LVQTLSYDIRGSNGGHLARKGKVRVLVSRSIFSSDWPWSILSLLSSAGMTPEREEIEQIVQSMTISEIIMARRDLGN